MRVWPGSKRTAVPAGMSSRRPLAAAMERVRAGQFADAPEPKE